MSLRTTLETLQSNNVIGALGASESATQRITLKTDSTAQTADDFRSMIIRSQDGAEIRLGDVARVELGMEEAQLRSRYDQDLVVFLAIYAAPGASEIAVPMRSMNESTISTRFFQRTSSYSWLLISQITCVTRFAKL